MDARTRSSERGGLTIIVALLLLTLLTVTVIGMSRGSLRETMILSAARQAADIRQVADSGVEWGIEWMDPKIWPQEDAKGSNANPLVHQAMEIIRDPRKNGEVFQVTSTKPADHMVITPFQEEKDLKVEPERTFGVQLSYMGRLPITDISVVDKRVYPLLWMVRAQGSVKIPGGLTFRHDREAWISTPLPEVRQ